MSKYINYSYDVQGTVGAINGAALGGIAGGILSKNNRGKGALVGSLVGAGLGSARRLAREYLLRRKLKKDGFEFDKHGNAIFKYGDGRHYRVSVGKGGNTSASGRDIKFKDSFKKLMNSDKKVNLDELKRSDLPTTRKANLPYRLLKYYLTGNDYNKQSDIRGNIYLDASVFKNKDAMHRAVAHEIGHIRDRDAMNSLKKRTETIPMEEKADRYAVEKLGVDPAKLHKDILDAMHKVWLRHPKGIIHRVLHGDKAFRKDIEEANRGYRGTWLENKAKGISN